MKQPLPSEARSSDQKLDMDLRSAMKNTEVFDSRTYAQGLQTVDIQGRHSRVTVRVGVVWTAMGGLRFPCSMAEILTPHVSFSSRDSIASIVRQQFGDQVDSIRTVEGRENSFLYSWPHSHVPKLSKSAMAQAGFVFAPDSECPDKNWRTGRKVTTLGVWLPLSLDILLAWGGTIHRQFQLQRDGQTDCDIGNRYEGQRGRETRRRRRREYVATKPLSIEGEGSAASVQRRRIQHGLGHVVAIHRDKSAGDFPLRETLEQSARQRALAASWGTNDRYPGLLGS
eukprot:754007-Hanusia_phi.AAC.2